MRVLAGKREKVGSDFGEAFYNSPSVKIVPRQPVRTTLSRLGAPECSAYASPLAGVRPGHPAVGLLYHYEGEKASGEFGGAYSRWFG
jgi:hypothetical protein